jgi:nucleoside 2-deoxyribosyltransferase
MSKRIRVYFAAPLFTQAEWQWNSRLAKELRKSKINVILPQDRAEAMLNGNEAFDPKLLFEANVSEIESCDVVLAVFDQADPDSGTCWECGYAYRMGRPIVGLRTDLRPGGDDSSRPVNLMLSLSCKEFLVVPLDKRDDLFFIAQHLTDLLQRATTVSE